MSDQVLLLLLFFAQRPLPSCGLQSLSLSWASISFVWNDDKIIWNFCYWGFVTYTVLVILSPVICGQEGYVRPLWRSASVNGRKSFINKRSPRGFELCLSLKWGLPQKCAFVFHYSLESGLKKKKSSLMIFKSNGDCSRKNMSFCICCLYSFVKRRRLITENKDHQTSLKSIKSDR